MSNSDSRTNTRTIRGSSTLQKILPTDATIFVEVIEKPLTLILPVFEENVDGKLIRIRRVAGYNKITLLSDKPLIASLKCKSKNKCNCKKNKKVTSLPVDDLITLQYSSECDSWFTM